MKITIKNESKSSEIKYPCLMHSPTLDTYVLFHEYECGIVIKSDHKYDDTYSNDWDMEIFTPFNGTVELSND